MSQARFAPGPSKPPSSASDEGRAFLQTRLSHLYRVIFWLYLAFFLILQVSYELIPASRPADTTFENVMVGAGLASLLTLWLVTRRSRLYGLDLLHSIDLVGMVVVGAVFGIQTVLRGELATSPLIMYVYVAFAVLGRALFVPSSARRTFAASLTAMSSWCAGLVAVARLFPESLDYPAPVVVGFGLATAVATALLAASGSSVIYGLRQQVRAALQLGQYTLDEKIGEGGMGAVYRARHAMLRRPTAVKLLPAARSSEQAVARFEREVQTTSELTHPNTVAIYDYGRSPDGVFYYAMEFLDGIDLETLVRRYGPQPAGRVARILSQACGSLDEAHDRGLIHRDIKPANLILCRRRKRPDACKVVDFGLVRELNREKQLTAADLVAGTPQYLAPEAVTDPDNVGPAADLYALGAVGYLLLAAVPVFEGKTVAEVCAHHVHSEPVPPSKRAPVSVPADLEALVLQCLAKDPAARPGSAAELREALLAVSSVHDWGEAAASAWWRAFEEERDERPSPAGLASPSVMSVNLSHRGPFGD
jgi:serine/threonine-protein kinase